MRPVFINFGAKAKQYQLVVTIVSLVMLIALQAIACAMGALPPGPGPFPEYGIMSQPVVGASRALSVDGWKVQIKLLLVPTLHHHASHAAAHAAAAHNFHPSSHAQTVAPPPIWGCLGRLCAWSSCAWCTSQSNAAYGVGVGLRMYCTGPCTVLRKYA